MKNIITILAISLFSLNHSAAQWVKINAIPTQNIVALATYGDTILAASGTDSLYKSIDEGISWSPLTVSNSAIVIITLKVIDDTIYVGTNSNGIFYSADYGQSWFHKGSNLLAVTGLEKKGNNLYASTLGSGVMIYNQNACDWIPFNNSLPSYSVNVNCILSTANALFIAAGANGTFYRYDFNLNAWNEEYYYGLLKPGLLIQKLINNSDTLFAVNGNRIIRSEDNGLSWTNDKTGSHNGFSRTIYSGVPNHYTITNVINGGTWIQHRDKLSVTGASWASDEEFFPTGYSYDILEFGNKLFLAKADGLYVKQLALEVNDLTHNKNDIQIYPNPSDGSAIKISGHDQINELIIFNAQGQILFSQKIDKSEFTIRPDLSKGIYFINLSFSGGKRIVSKLIIE
jgi:Secretion system C-terminal sorting domain